MRKSRWPHRSLHVGPVQSPQPRCQRAADRQQCGASESRHQSGRRRLSWRGHYGPVRPPTYSSSRSRLTIGSLVTAITLLAFILAAFLPSLFLGILNGLLCLLVLWRCRKSAKIRCHKGAPMASAWGRVCDFFGSYIGAVGLCVVVLATFLAILHKSGTPSPLLEAVPARVMAGFARYLFWMAIWPGPLEIVWTDEVIDMAQSADEDGGSPVLGPSAPDSPAPSNAPASPRSPQNR